MSFQQGLSGLNGASKSLDAIGNNVANSGTVGFKSAITRFADVYAASLTGGGASQVGVGTSVNSVFQQFTQGNVSTSNNPLDLAVNGSGMFRMSNNGVISYTRNGQFQVDKNGFIVNGSGLRVTGYTADSSGQIVPGSVVDLQLNTANIPPAATSSSQVQLNLDSRAAAPSAMTGGTLTGTVAGGLPASTTISTGVNDLLSLVVDGVPVTVQIPAGTYTQSNLASQVETAINAGLSASGTSVTVTLSSAPTNLIIQSSSVGTSGSQGSGSDVTSAALTSGGTAAAALLGAPTAAAGSITGSTVLGATTSIIAGANDILTLDIGGSVASLQIPAGNYTPAQLATQLQGQVITAFSLPLATVSVNGGGQLVIDDGGVGSAFALASGGDAVTALMNAPTSATGTDNFSSSNTLSYTASTAQTVYDSLGNPHNMTMYFVKTDFPGRWQMYTSLDGGTTSAATTLNFSSSGKLTTVMPINESFTLTNGATSPLDYSLDLTGTTQYGISFGVNQLLQDGFTSGRLSGISVSTDGIIQGRYSNGKSRDMGQLILVNFNNNNGLQSLGGNQWAETADSGQPIPGTPGQGSLGALQAAAVEESNVDLTAELVNMITQQRVYQANAQTIKTQDSVLQTLVNLR